MKTQDKVILIAALILPGGLVALGVWKSIELLSKKGKEK